jgi:allantoate deiminase
MIMAPHLPAAMIFLRSPGGVSHHPDETVLIEDVAAALRAGTLFLTRFPGWLESRPRA